MAKVTGPLFSDSASGNLRKTIVYTRSKNKEIVKGNRLKKNDTYSFDIKKYDTQTSKQLAVREEFKNALQSWKELTEEQKNEVKEKARMLGLSGTALYIREYMKQNYEEKQYLIYYLFGIGQGILLPLFVNEYEIGALLTSARGN